MARRHLPTTELDDDWAADDIDLEAIDPTTGAASSPRSPARAAAAVYRRSRRRAWLASAALTGLCLVGFYSLLSHRAAVTMTTAWTQAVSDADALSTVMEGLRTSAMLADVSGEPQDAFAEARQRSVRAMRTRLTAQREAVASAVPADPRLISLRFRALDQLDAWGEEMDAFLVRKGLWLRTPEFGALEEPMRKAAQRWRVDVPSAEPVDIPGDSFLARLARPSDEPIPVVITALVSSGHRLDIDLQRQTVTRTQLTEENVGLGPVAYGMEVEGDHIVVLTPGTTVARLPLTPSAEVTTDQRPPRVLTDRPELAGVELPAGRMSVHVTRDASTGVVVLTHVDGDLTSPPTDSAIAVVQPDGTTREIARVDGPVLAISAANGWVVFGERGASRLGLRAVHVETGRVLTVRLPDPYVTAFVAHPARP